MLVVTHGILDCTLNEYYSRKQMICCLGLQSLVDWSVFWLIHSNQSLIGWTIAGLLSPGEKHYIISLLGLIHYLLCQRGGQTTCDTPHSLVFTTLNSLNQMETARSNLFNAYWAFI